MTGPAGGVTGIINANFRGTFYGVSPGASFDLKCPFNMQIDSWWVYGVTGGSAIFDVHKTNHANYPTTFTKMNGTTGPFTTLSTKNTGNLSGWSHSQLSQGDIMRITVGTGTTGMPSCLLAMNYRKTS
jgi:hypothetical protein